MKSDRITTAKRHGPSLFRIGQVWHYRFQRDGIRIQRSTHETDRNRAEEIAWYAFGGRQTVPTLSALTELWEDAHKPIVSNGHIRSVDIFRRRHLYGLGEVRIDRIRTENVEAARAKHLVDHAPDTANHWLRILKLLFGWAVKRDLIPAVPWKVGLLKVQKHPRVILPVAKASAFLSAVDDATGARPALRTAVRLMLGLGLRESEALSARWEWIDWERSIYTPGITKGREAIALPMPGWLVDHLGDRKDTDGLIVRSPRGGPYCPGSTRTTILKASVAAGVPGLSPHRLRGTFATLLSEGGTPVQTIQRMLRHKDVKTTVGYCETDMTRVVAVQEAIAKKWGSTGENPAKCATVDCMNSTENISGSHHNRVETETGISDPNTADTAFACAELACHFLEAGTLADCEKERHCPFAYQRRREEDFIEREKKDAARRVVG